MIEEEKQPLNDKSVGEADSNASSKSPSNKKSSSSKKSSSKKRKSKSKRRNVKTISDEELGPLSEKEQ